MTPTLATRALATRALATRFERFFLIETPPDDAGPGGRPGLPSQHWQAPVTSG
jgi:hypothetical protein